MNNFAHIKRCLELSERDIASALEDRRVAKALLEQLAKVSRPGDGGPKLLLLFAKLAGSDVNWIDGALRVEMAADGDGTVIEVLGELGLGMHERVFASFKMSVPLEEFARAVERVPHMIAPLAVSPSKSGRLVLSASGEEGVERDAAAGSSVSIDDESLYNESGRQRASNRPRSGKTLRPGPPPTDTAPTKAPPPPPRERMATLLGYDPPVHPLPTVPAPRIARVSAMPTAPPLPHAEQRAASVGAPSMKRAVVAKVPLTRVQVRRASRPPQAVERRGSRPPPAVERRGSRPPPVTEKPPPASPSKHPKRASIRPPGKGQSKPPERHSKAPPAHSGAPKARGRAAGGVSEPPDEEAIDTGWDETEK